MVLLVDVVEINKDERWMKELACLLQSINLQLSKGKEGKINAN